MNARPAPRGRQVAILVTTLVVALVLATIGIALYDRETHEAQALSELRVQAEILAASTTAALEFSDIAVIQEYLSTLRSNTGLESAAVYDETGKLVAALPDRDHAPPRAPPLGQSATGSRLVVTLPAVQDGKTVGTVTLSAAAEPLSRRLSRYWGLLLAVVMSSLVLGVVLTAQAALRQANRELERRAAALADANTKLQREIVDREKAEEALRQAQKIEAVGQLTGGIAHDFNNMLSIIIGSLTILQRKTGRGEIDVGKYADAALEGARRAASLTQRLLAFSRRQALKPETLDPNRLVGSMSELLRRTLGETIQVETVLAGGVWHVYADPHQLESALLNLAVNARDAMPQGGKLTIETANAHLDPHYAEATPDVKAGQYVLIAVTDTGTGMGPEIVAKAFDPFFTTKAPGKGTGLGLSQVFGFVKQSGGHVKLYSEVGDGTTVKIYLPRHFGDQSAQTEIRRDVPQGQRGTLILVVEDEERVREMAVGMLRELGYDVIAAAGGRQALEELRRRSDIGLLFTDVVMPEMNGRVLAEEAHKIRPDLPVLFTTGYTRNAIVHNGVVDPGVILVSKPYALEDLARHVAAALRRESRVI